MVSDEARSRPQVCQYATGEAERAIANVKLAAELEPENELYGRELADLVKLLAAAAESDELIVSSEPLQ